MPTSVVAVFRCTGWYSIMSMSVWIEFQNRGKVHWRVIIVEYPNCLRLIRPKSPVFTFPQAERQLGYNSLGDMIWWHTSVTRSHKPSQNHKWSEVNHVSKVFDTVTWCLRECHVTRYPRNGLLRIRIQVLD